MLPSDFNYMPDTIIGLNKSYNIWGIFQFYMNIEKDLQFFLLKSLELILITSM